MHKVRAQRHSRIASYIVFRHNSKNKNRRILKFGSTFYSADCRNLRKKNFKKKKIDFEENP